MNKKHLALIAVVTILIIVVVTVTFAQLLEVAAQSPTAQGLIGTTTQNGFSLCSDRCTFYANGRDWVFWDNGTHYVFSSRADGSDWSPPTFLASVSTFYSYAVAWNGTCVAYLRGGLSGGLYFRMGTPYSDGRIAWAASEQTISSSVCLDPSVAFDTNGFVYACYSVNGGNLVVSKSSATDGTWVTALNYPVTLDSVSSQVYPYGSLVPLAGGKMGVVWCIQDTVPSAQALYYSICNGAVWSSMASFTTNNPKVNGEFDLVPFSVASSGNTIYVDFVDSSGNLRFNSYTYGIGWRTEVTLVSGLSAVTFPSITVANNDFYIFYDGNPTANTVYYVEYNGVSWGGPQYWFSDNAETLYPEETGVSDIYSMISSFQNSGNGEIGLVYLTLSSSPYNVEFMSLAVAPPTYSNLTATDQVLIITLIVSMIIALSAVIIAKKRRTWKIQRGIQETGSC